MTGEKCEKGTQSELNEAESALCLNLQMKYLGMKNRKVNRERETKRRESLALIRTAMLANEIVLLHKEEALRQNEASFPLIPDHNEESFKASERTIESNSVGKARLAKKQRVNRCMLLIKSP
jgi:hypothetical protein